MKRLASLLDLLPVKTIDRYLMRQFLIAYGICGAAVVGLFVMLEGLTRLDNFIQQDAPLIFVIIRYFAATVPVFFSQYLGPVLTLMAAMFAIIALNKGGEITPLKAAGLSIQRILMPFFSLAILFGLLMIGVQEFLIPILKDEIRLATHYGERKSKSGIRDIEIPDSLNNLISIERYYPQQRVGKNVEVKLRFATVEEELIRALAMHWEKGQWILRDGNIQRYNEKADYIRNPGKSGPEAYSQRFAEYPFETDIRPVDLEATDYDIPYLSHTELSHQIKRHEHLKHLEVKLHRRYAFPIANVILLLMGVPLVLRGEQRSIVAGIAFAIAVSAIYLLSDTVCADLGNKGALPPMLAAWLPVLFFGALGLTLFDGMES